MRSWVLNLKVTFNSSVYLIPLKRRGFFSVLLSPCVLRVLYVYYHPVNSSWIENPLMVEIPV